jgi:hypothetical protein
VAQSSLYCICTVIDVPATYGPKSGPRRSAKLLLIGAVLLAVIGLALFGLARLGVSDLPGTVKWKSRGGNMTVYAPIGLMIVLSVVGTILLNLLFRR